MRQRKALKQGVHFQLTADEAEWLSDLADRSEMSRTDVLRDLIRAAHVAMSRSTERNARFTRDDGMLGRKELAVSVIFPLTLLPPSFCTDATCPQCRSGEPCH